MNIKKLFIIILILFHAGTAFASGPLTGSFELSVSDRSGNTNSEKYFLDVNVSGADTKQAFRDNSLKGTVRN